MAAGGTLRAALPARPVPSYPHPESKSFPVGSDVRIRDLTSPHVESVNFFLGEGLKAVVRNMRAREFRPGGLGSRAQRMRVWVDEVTISAPARVDNEPLYPRACREGGNSYSGTMRVTFGQEVGGERRSFTREMGDVPIMVMSSKCHLNGLSPAQKAYRGEELAEAGGYFITGGIERVLRLLQMNRRNFPMAVDRSAFRKRGPLFTTKGIMLRSVRDDESAITNTLHFLADGGSCLRFSLRRQEFFLPAILLLRALRDTSDVEIFSAILGGTGAPGTRPIHRAVADRVQLLLRDGASIPGVADERELKTKRGVRAFLGKRFRSMLPLLSATDDMTDEEAGTHLLHEYILVHLSEGQPVASVDGMGRLSAEEADDAKFDLLCLMLRKLYLFVVGDVIEDSADAVANHELLLPGHLLCTFVKEKLVESLSEIEANINRELSRGRLRAAGAPAAAMARRRVRDESAIPDALSEAVFHTTVNRLTRIGDKVHYLMATGTLVSSSGLDLMQASGYTVVADRINHLRFLTHFRSVHRGQFFSTMKTTAVRRLLPESWGFLCPVHTPDGAPCGLLNHLAAGATAVAHPTPAPGLLGELYALGVTPIRRLGNVPAGAIPVVLDGRVVGAISAAGGARVAGELRKRKAQAAGGALPPGEAASEALADVIGDLGDGEDEIRSGGAMGPIIDADADPAEARRSQVAMVHASRRQFRDRVRQLLRRAGTGRSPGSGGALTVPASLEVAFVPPPAMLAGTPEGGPKGGRGAAAGLTARMDAAATDEGEEEAKEDPKHARKHARTQERKEGGAAGAGAVSVSGIEDVEPTDLSGPFPGLFLFTGAARLVRAVGQLRGRAADAGADEATLPHSLEVLGPLEQQFLHVACTPEDWAEVGARVGDATAPSFPPPPAEDGRPGFAYSHLELTPMAMLSMAASLTPFSDLNQSPRNMYQCQMAKQTMGTPAHALGSRTDTKLYRIQNPQAPLTQTWAQSEYGLDMWPNGTNAVVAVIAYTGMDMEDAMIVNKGAYERGFAHATVTKTVSIDTSKSEAGRFVLGAPAKITLSTHIGRDGLPIVGSTVRKGDAFYSVLDTVSGKTKGVVWKEMEPGVVESVRVIDAGADGARTKASITLRLNRNPVVGDKFSSRHGQKGVMSMLWPQADMPFSDEGLTPDVIINPHAFPSRMTIGMLVESMAGKAGAVHGRFQDATPFRFGERQRAVDYFGEQLRAAGYQYHGSETLYAGSTGEPLEVDVFMGVVYYQRLRHMVNDKAQVRSTGPVDRITRQPVKGRKRGGGIRFGEMERDSFLAHGGSALLQDRLLHGSDKHSAVICTYCGSFMGSHVAAPREAADRDIPVGEMDGEGGVGAGARGGLSAVGIGLGGGELTAGEGGGLIPSSRWTCRTCGTGAGCRVLPLPHVLRYLAHELAAMNIRLTLDVTTPKH